jgi:hypothetical protein
MTDSSKYLARLRKITVTVTHRYPAPLGRLPDPPELAVVTFSTGAVKPADFSKAIPAV